MTTKIVEQTSEVEEHDHIQSEAEEELEAAVEPPSSPLGQRKPHRSREKQKIPKVSLPQPAISRGNEKMRKKVQDVDAGKVENLTRFETIGASPTPIVSRASLLADPRINELAEKPGLVLHMVL
ncbi:hypothetical protein GBA52_026939 [Prunus armeniaca]|nr:hypothetical protein GBA52_026939 [Prunus armeniaca]